MNKIKKYFFIILLMSVIPFSAFSETYLCVEDKDTITGTDRENAAFNRISDHKFEMTVIGNKDETVPLNVNFEDDEVISLILPAEFSKFALFMILLNKKDKTYIGVAHLLSEPITGKTNIFDVFDKGKCQLL